MLKINTLAMSDFDKAYACRYFPQKRQSLSCRTHSTFMKEIFYYIFPSGIDLVNIEIKESSCQSHCFKVGKKDIEAEYILFYDHDSDNFYFAHSSCFNPKGKSSSYSENYVKRFSPSYDLIEALNLVEENIIV